MKKIIPIFVLTLILFSFSAYAQALCFPPYPVFGKYSSNLASAEVKITVHDTRVVPTKDIVIVERINSNGEYQTDLGNIDNCYFNGMTGEIVACTGAPECTQSFTVSGTKFRKDFVFTFVPSSGGGSGEGGGTTTIGGGGGGGSYTTPGGSTVVPFGCQQWSACEGGKSTQTCTLSNGVTSKESRDCLVPVVVPVSPTPAEPVVVPVEPTVPVEPVTPPVEPVVPKPEPESNILEIALISLIAGIIGLFAWGKGFAALIKSKLKKADEAEKAGNKELAKKYRATAEKMAKSVVTNFLAGKYKK